MDSRWYGSTSLEQEKKATYGLAAGPWHDTLKRAVPRDELILAWWDATVDRRAELEAVKLVRTRSGRREYEYRKYSGGVLHRQDDPSYWAIINL